MADEEMQAETPEGQEPVESEESTPSKAVELSDQDATEENDDSEPVEKPVPKRNGFQKRISGLTEKNRELQARLDAIEAEKNKPAVNEPSRDDFQDYEQYLEARAEWVAEQKFSNLQAQATARQAERDRQAQEREVESKWDASQDAARERYEDFDDVVYGDVSISEPMGLAIKAMPDGAEVAYHLGKHPKDADRIARMSPIDQLIEMGAIRERLKERTAKPVPPKPVTRGRTSQSTAASGLNDDLPMDKWLATRNKQVGRS